MWLLFLLSKGGESIIDKIKIILGIFSAALVIMVVGFFVSSLNPNNNPKQPDNHMISHELIIHNTGDFSNLYVDEINLDRGNQPFGLSAEVKSEDLHLYVLAHETAEQEVNEYVKWIISYYGAEEIKH